MILQSHAAGRNFPRNGLTGMAGLGLTPEEITYALVHGTPSGMPGGEAYQARYGATGSYLREPSVIATYGATATGYADVGAPGSWDQGSPMAPSLYRDVGDSSAPPLQYPMEDCSINIAGSGGALCVARNDARQQANMVLAENARRAYNLQVCLNNAALTPGTVNDRACGGFAPLPVPPAEGTPGVAIRMPGGMYAAGIVGETAQQQADNRAAWADYQTQQQAASNATNQPNRNAPPRTQPGEVPTSGGITAAELAAILAAQNKGTATGPGFSLVDADGKILGLDPKMLMLIAAGVGALMLLKK